MAAGDPRGAARCRAHPDDQADPAPERGAGRVHIHDFRIDHQAGTVRCPAGYRVPVTSSGRVSFARRCQGCPLRRRCTTAKGGRTIHLHPTRTSYAPPAAAR